MENKENMERKKIETEENDFYFINPIEDNVDFDETKIPLVDIKEIKPIPEETDEDEDEINEFDSENNNAYYLDNNEYNYEDYYEEDYENKKELEKLKKQRAARLAELFLKLYKKLKEVVYNISEIDEVTLDKWYRNNFITIETLNYPIELYNGKVITVLEYIDKYYNREIAKSLSINENGECELDKDFYKSVKKSLTEIFYKKGIGTGEEFSLIIYLATDIIETSINVLSQRYLLKKLIKNINKEIGVENEENIKSIYEQNKDKKISNNQNLEVNNTNYVNLNQISDDRLINNQINNIDNNVEEYNEEKNITTNNNELNDENNTVEVKTKKRGRKKGSKNKKSEIKLFI